MTEETKTNVTSSEPALSEATSELAESAKVTSLRAGASNIDDKAIRRTRTVATIILIILILIILAACAMMYALLGPGRANIGGHDTAGITWIRSIYGHGTALQDQINPTSVFFDPDGNSIWVTDSVRFRIVQYDLYGRLLRIINADINENEMIFPSRIAISPQGWHYVAEQTYNQVQIFDENWVHQRTIHIETPISLSANDEMLVIGSQSGFAAFTYRGEPIGTQGIDSPDEINHFDYVHGIFIDENSNIFALDTFGNRLVKYDSEGFPIYEVHLGFPGNQGIGGARDEDADQVEREFPAGMQLPKGITMDAAGRINIIDMFDFSVAIFDASTGDFIRKVGQHGLEDGRFHNPNCIDYNPRMDMFASAEASLGRVQLFSIEGSSADQVSQLRRQFNDFLNACCIPLIIILIILAAYLISRFLARKRREREMTAVLADSSSEGAGSADKVDVTTKQQT